MSSPGQKRGTCGHLMDIFDGHLKCDRCCDKGVGEDNCVHKKDCPICKAFTPEQLAIPTYRERKNKDTSQKPFFDPGANTSKLAESAESSSPGLVQATGDAVPSRGDEIQKNATEPVEAPGAGTATQPVQAPGANPDVLPPCTSDATLSVDQIMTGSRVV